ncbi:Uncharacterised protein [Sebaldella termitidis]|uniref:Lipoprotein n=1 Tax=Sebaldella termitidis (strain ATCC 33386 / NCTC 11300) TaxID=526218 RepID=D1AHF1_SEBTE|nr:hypothetical protein [Sebaldella termitidis]ACZ08185.1 hypothetical protein Sterm_1319 [Sebaldella termitidis ATCC 33386]SUI23488.1 Uncharacterised protein [Sebaldella termitidis]
MVEKILIILILCLGTLGCDAMLSEADKQLKVIEKLEKIFQKSWKITDKLLLDIV